MAASDADRLFAGSIPQLYDEYMVPLIFAPYAVDLAARVAQRWPTSLLEIAAGTGAVTRQLADALPEEVALTATDLNQAMLDRAIAVGTRRPVHFRQADAMQLPFPDESFDAVVCQFGAMFFPDKPKAFAEARRVLRPGGTFFFSVWDAIEHNEIADVVTEALRQRYPDDPPRFMARVPHGYSDTAAILKDVADGGFSARPALTTLAARSRAPSARMPAVAYCQGTVLRSEIETRDPAGLLAATDAAEAALVRRFGDGPVDGRIQAHIIAVQR